MLKILHRRKGKSPEPAVTSSMTLHDFEDNIKPILIDQFSAKNVVKKIKTKIEKMAFPKSVVTS